MKKYTHRNFGGVWVIDLETRKYTIEVEPTHPIWNGSIRSLWANHEHLTDEDLTYFKEILND